MEGAATIVFRSSLGKEVVATVQCMTLGDLRTEAARHCIGGFPVIHENDRYVKFAPHLPPDAPISDVIKGVHEVYVADADTLCAEADVCCESFDCLKELEKDRKDLDASTFSLVWNAVIRSAKESIQDACRVLDQVMRGKAGDAMCIVFPILGSAREVVVQWTMQQDPSKGKFKTEVESNVRTLQALIDSIQKELIRTTQKEERQQQQEQQEQQEQQKQEQQEQQIEQERAILQERQQELMKRQQELQAAIAKEQQEREKQLLEDELQMIDQEIEELQKALEELNKQEHELLHLIATHTQEAQKQDRTQRQEKGSAQAEQMTIQVIQSALQALQAALASAQAATPFSAGLVATLQAAIQMYQQLRQAAQGRKQNHEKNAHIAGQRSVAEKQQIAQLKSSLSNIRSQKATVLSAIQNKRSRVIKK